MGLKGKLKVAPGAALSTPIIPDLKTKPASIVLSSTSENERHEFVNQRKDTIKGAARTIKFLVDANSEHALLATEHKKSKSGKKKRKKTNSVDESGNDLNETSNHEKHGRKSTIHSEVEIARQKSKMLKSTASIIIEENDTHHHHPTKDKRKSRVQLDDADTAKLTTTTTELKGKKANRKSGKKKLKKTPVAAAPLQPKPLASTISIATINIRPSMLFIRPKEEKVEKTPVAVSTKEGNEEISKSKEEMQEKPKPKEENLDKPKLDLADAGLLGITNIKMQEDDEPPPPPPKTRGKNAAKVAKLIHDHLVHKQAVATYNLLRNFRPVQILLLSCGLFPLQITKDSEGVWTFNSSFKKPTGILFLVSSFFNVYTVLVGGFNLFVIKENVTILELDDTPAGVTERNLGRILLDRHVMILIFMGLAIIESFVAVLVVLFRRKKFVDHFTDWSDKLLLIQMDMTSGTFLSACVTSVTFVCILLIIFIMSVCFGSASTVGGPLCLGMLMLRNMLPYDWMISPVAKGFVHAVGLVFMILFFISSKAPLLFFVHKCKLLKNGFALWNARLYNATLQSTDIQQTKEGRTTYGILYEDYFNLLRLKEDMDRLFGGIVETFLCLQSISITCELYLGLRAIRRGHDQDDAALTQSYFIRPYDWIPGLLLFVVSIIFIHSVSMNAIELGEEIQSGLEIIRRSTMLGKKKEEELFFMASLFTNYTEYNYGTNSLEGLGFFYFDRETHGAIIGLTAALFMIVYQFQPVMDHNVYQNNVRRDTIGRFLCYTEGLPENHWLPRPK